MDGTQSYWAQVSAQIEARVTNRIWDAGKEQVGGGLWMLSWRSNRHPFEPFRLAVWSQAMEKQRGKRIF